MWSGVASIGESQCGWIPVENSTTNLNYWTQYISRWHKKSLRRKTCLTLYCSGINYLHSKTRVTDPWIHKLFSLVVWLFEYSLLRGRKAFLVSSVTQDFQCWPTSIIFLRASLRKYWTTIIWSNIFKTLFTNRSFTKLIRDETLFSHASTENVFDSYLLASQ